MNTKKTITLAALSLLLVVLMLLFFLGGKDREIDSELSLAEEASELGLEEERETQTISLFFLSHHDRRLHPEEREIYADIPLVKQVQQTLEELIRGSLNGGVSPLPEDTRLREVFLTRRGIAYVDFSRDIQDKHPSGSAAEMATVYAIVNSLTHNFKAIRRVFILVDGGERETLCGHIDLSRPILPRYDLIAR